MKASVFFYGQTYIRITHYLLVLAAVMVIGCKADDQNRALHEVSNVIEQSQIATLKTNCEANNLADCVALARTYANNSDLKANPETITALYRKACKGESAAGCAWLAETVMDEDLASARKAAKKSCDRLSMSGCIIYSKAMRRGPEDGRDYKAARWAAKLACANQPADYCNQTGDDLRSGDNGWLLNPADARDYYIAGCEAGAVQSCISIADMMTSSEGGAEDKPAAVEFYQKACKILQDEDCLLAKNLSATLTP